MRLMQIRTALAVLASLALLAGGVSLVSSAMAAAGGPTVVLSSTSASTTDAASIPVTAVFSESVNGFGTSSIIATNASVSGFSGSGADYSFNIIPVADGEVAVHIAADVATSTASGTGNQGSNTLTFISDRSAPVISNVIVAPTTNGATITWNTDTAATSQVFWGTSAALGDSSTIDLNATTSHSVTITGLLEATLYHYVVSSTDSGGTATSSDAVFTTSSTASSTPLAVTSVDTVQSTATADDTFLHGFEWVMHLTVPDTEDAFRMKFSDFTMSGSSSTIPVASNIRIFSPQSSNAVDESSAITATGNNYGGWLNLTGDTAGGTAGRQIDVTIQVRVPSGTAAGSYSTTFGAQSVPQSAT